MNWLGNLLLILKLDLLILFKILLRFNLKLTH